MDNYTHSEAFDYSSLGNILDAPATHKDMTEECDKPDMLTITDAFE